MTRGELALLTEHLLRHLPRLDRELRRGAVERASARVFVLTDSHVTDQTTLTYALARVASEASKRARFLESVMQDARTAFHRSVHAAERERIVKRALARMGGASPELSGDDALEVLLEAGAASRAESVDLAMVALSAAASLSRASTASPQRATVTWETTLEVCFELLVANPKILRERALELVNAVLALLPEGDRETTLGIPRLRALRELATGSDSPYTVSGLALEALDAVEDQDFALVVRAALESTQTPDAHLGRYEAVRVAGISHLPTEDKLALLLERRSDPSEHVRQGLARALAATRGSEAARQLEALSLRDSSERVRAVALLELSDLALREHAHLVCFIGALDGAVESGRRLLHRSALEAAHRFLGAFDDTTDYGELAARLSPLLNQETTEVSELAAVTLRRLELAQDPDLGSMHERLARAVGCLREGETDVVQLDECTELARERALFLAGAHDFPWGIREAPRTLEITRGEQRSFKLWRLFHELRHPAPDKRLGVLHTTARNLRHPVVTAPLTMAEVTMTRVPGERVAVDGNSWGSFLPRVDDLLAALEFRESGRRVLTAFGTLHIKPAASWLQRRKAKNLLTVRYDTFAELRLDSLRAKGEQRTRFVQRVGELGFTLSWDNVQLRFETRAVSLLPERIRAFYPPQVSVRQMASIPLALWFEDLLKYLLEPSGNTAWHLALVVWVILTMMLARAAYVQARFAAAKRRIPLSVGGWGSRGKSGTERIKAALFHSQHFDVVSKTTGCEAMIIVAARGQPAHELFLYRPYDKATIWEQSHVVEIADGLGTQIFLWECMALQPEFVDILAADWMRDTVSTITNAYPDHEDIMGPSGEDVARVIGRFVPRRGAVFSTEGPMQPILRETAVAKQSKYVAVPDLEADLIPEDLLSRFPYAEHPKNVALVLSLAEHFEIPKLSALIDCAEFIIPDLGVLATYPTIEHRGRRLTFSNGMSANERAGFLSNWQRLDFNEHNPHATPERWLVAVINNRADRVPRSHVFAELFARDVSVDRMVVIGTNQKGMRRLLERAATEVARRITLSRARALEVTAERFDFLQVPNDAACIGRRMELAAGDAWTALGAQVRAALDAFASDPSEAGLARFHTVLKELSAQDAKREAQLRAIASEWVKRLQVTKAVELEVAEGDVQAATAALRKAYVEIFKNRIVVIDDSHASGDQIIDTVCAALPEGADARVLGCQNIKGTGLDLAYRFVSLDRVKRWLRALQERPGAARESIAALAQYGDYGLFDARLARVTLERLCSTRQTDYAATLDEMSSLIRHLQDVEKERQAALTDGPKKSTLDVVLRWIEPLLEPVESIRRRRAADAVFRRLVDGRISRTRAERSLREIVARQKGGWLAKSVRKVGRSRADRATRETEEVAGGET